MTTRILIGHVLDRLADLPERSVHCVWTSPPYWGLRSYGTEAQIWGGDPAHPHEWSDTITLPLPAGVHGWNADRGDRSSVQAQRSHRERGQWCACGAWRGEHGLEPSFDLWLAHEVAIFRAVRRVLRDDGTVWINIGDAYARSSNGRPAADVEDDDRTFRDKPFNTTGGIFKPKDRLLMPARLAIELHADGWYIRDEIVWNKPNPMPSSVRDRTTPAHEMLYHLTKSPRYFFDQAAVREPFADGRMGRDYKMPDGWATHEGGHGSFHRDGCEKGRPASERNRGGRVDGFTKPNDIDPSANGGRNRRSVWTLPLEPFKGAHFATAPTSIVRPCILAGTSAKGVCPDCGAPWERIVKRFFIPQPDAPNSIERSTNQEREFDRREGSERGSVALTTIGFRPTCACYDDRYRDDLPAPRRARKMRQRNAWSGRWLRVKARPGLPQWKTVPATILDPFGGSGTTALVADELGRDAILIELNPSYAEIARTRIRKSLGRVVSEIADEEPDNLPLFEAAK